MYKDRYPTEDYYCGRCKNFFTPAYYPVLCPCCGNSNLKTKKSLSCPERDFRKDPTVLDILKNCEYKRIANKIKLRQNNREYIDYTKCFVKK